MNAARPKLTVLTDPVPYGRDLLGETARSLARTVRDRVKPHPMDYNRSPYRGHPAVTRSLIEGLTSIRASFNYNPAYPARFAGSVVVLSGVRTLRQAIAFKRRGLIKALHAGPNIVVFASDHDSILASPEIDSVITPCDLIIDLYLEDCPSLEGRCFAWPAGVDTRYWTPGPAAERRQVLIFEKQNKGPVGPVQPYVDFLAARGYEVAILKYGAYNHGQYLAQLQRSCLMVGFVTDESQGIAWAEAWSADVPTLLWRNTTHSIGSRTYRCSTAPYLCADNGLFFDDLDDFAGKLAWWESHRDAFAPRAWTEANMSDAVCAARLYERVAAR